MPSSQSRKPKPPPIPGLTAAGKRALRALYEAEEGSLQSRGVLAAGEWLPFDGKTYLRLVGLGLVEVNGTRIKPSNDGRRIAAALPAYVPEVPADAE